MSARSFYVTLGLGMLLGAASLTLGQEVRRSPFAEGRKLPGDLSDLLRVADEPDGGRPASGPRAAVPAAADQAKTLAKIKEIFGRPNSNAERAKLSGEMLVAGSDEKDASTRYVLFRYAGSLALEAKDLKGALKAIDRLERDFDVDALTMMASVLDRLLARDTAADVLAAAQQAYSEAIRRDHYDAATQLGGVAYAAARRLKKRELLDELKTRGQRLGEMRKALAAIRPAIATLKQRPDDVDANRQVGEYLCFSKGELSRGLPLLAKGKHELAELERSTPVDADTQQRLGDGWWDLASKHNGQVRTVLQQHAVGWYRRALPQLKGLSKVKVQKRVDEFSIPPNPKSWAKACVLAYSFDRATLVRHAGGVYVRDLSGNENHAKLIGATSVTDESRSFVNFDGTNDSVIAVKNPRTNGSFSVSLMIKYLGPGTPNKVYWTLLNMNKNSGLGSDDPFHIWVDSKTRTLSARVADGSTKLDLTSTVSTSDSRWHHVGLSYDKRSFEYRFYVDGKRIAHAKVRNGWIPAKGSGPLTFGVWPQYKSFFRGSLADVAIWDRSITDKEMTEIYAYFMTGKSYCNAMASSTKRNGFRRP